ncbi:NifX-associated nitrogen fixation protein [Gloeocapsopsis crepidinum LEGE 06123]|uniref:NifX-associated nitrogen fixation protein n=2 Tax=Gloeocapsopsis crepidinum TaxID=693223 RepID=A0ABR9UU88_9CHRO|nr:NifX-associated nitrogen fixation protein [Gloeocapsopsis crepidinum]MBE9191846.1 NifX-associated nitrogen fixation protein [Gloeocapsopsis crepidinum LEGE 06123]
MTTETVSQISEETLNSPFLQELVRQIRAQDSYGFYRNWSNELIIKPYVVSKEAKRKISVEGDVDPVTKARIMSFYRAIAAQIEQETGLISQVVIDLSHEGFGWALIFSGRLLLVARTLRDAQRFGFDSLEKLLAEGEKMTQKGIELAQKYTEVAKA